MKFMEGMGQLIWPDAAGIAGSILLNWAGRGLDQQQGWSKAFKRSQDYIALGAGVASAYGYSSMGGAWKEVSRGAFASNLTLVMDGVLDAVYPPEEAFPVEGRRMTQAEVRRLSAARGVRTNGAVNPARNVAVMSGDVSEI